MKKLPIGLQSIRKILAKGPYVYVDKTRYIKELLDDDSSHFFMSRPRRFGKSLLLSTLAEICSGNKELFKGCEIYNSDYEWQKYPVLLFDFSQIGNKTPKEFDESLKRALIASGNLYDLSIEAPTIREGVKNLIMALHGKMESDIVVLVDEYDDAIINKLDALEMAKENRDTLKDFSTALKSLDDYLRFTFITGVSKFSQVSLFSGPNNLTDITMDSRYAGIVGYTEQELREYFQDHVQAIVKYRGDEGRPATQASVLEEVRKWYNGYRFSSKDLSVYNPYSTLRYLKSQEAESYWYSSGTPSFLIGLIKKTPQVIIPLSGISASRSALSDISRIDRIDLPALMFQTGYLTIREYNGEKNFYTLDFPNREVREAFFNSLLKEFAEIDPLAVDLAGEEVQEDLKNSDVGAFIEKINSHFTKIPYHVFRGGKEGFYHAVFFTLLEKSGIRTRVEEATSTGRIDLVCTLPNVTYVFEFKLDKTADIALQQAVSQKYREPYLHRGKETLVIGINFHSKSRSIGDWKGVLYSPAGEVIKELLPEKK